MGDQLDEQILVRWNHTVNLLRQKVGPRWAGFVSLAQPQAQMGTVLLLAVPNEYTRDVFQNTINVQLKEALEASFGAGFSEAIVIDTSLGENSGASSQATSELASSAEQSSQAQPTSRPLSEPVANSENNSSAAPTEENTSPRFEESSRPSVHDLEAELGKSSPSFAHDTQMHAEQSKYSPENISETEALSTSGPVEHTWESTARLNPKYTFDTFVIGQSNRFAHAAAFAVSETPASAYNPLFIYGDSGLGKTHLLHAIGHYAKHLYPDLRVRYVNSEEFTNDFINSIRDDEGSSFKQIYRNVDMLLIDDIQFLAEKERTQEEFFHTFNALHNHQKQVVITSDMPPKLLTGFAERMRSRFEWGLITDVQPPELETRIAILRKKAQNESLDVSDTVMEYIASNITTNIRELEGALIRVTAFASLNKQKVDRPLAELVLKDLITDAGAQEITATQVLAATAAYFNVTIEDLQSKSRNRTLVTARQIAMYLLRELTDMSLPKIGQEFGGRDHTTVMHADRKIRELMAERRQIFNQVTELTNIIKQEQRTHK
ncbi:MAG: chromosomal replication initiator protein DnaA [Rothia sp. (in: high G+C Gram-positive bacteria)]|nr:chromosomal replication initiator protein DnaA [Rothia sp. (in: high G+C Gram-positive bacteria)]